LGGDLMAAKKIEPIAYKTKCIECNQENAGIMLSNRGGENNAVV